MKLSVNTLLMCSAVILTLGLAGCQSDSTTIVKSAASPTGRPEGAKGVTVAAPKPELNSDYKDQIGSKAK